MTRHCHSRLTSKIQVSSFYGHRDEIYTRITHVYSQKLILTERPISSAKYFNLDWKGDLISYIIDALCWLQMYYHFRSLT